MYLSPPLFCFFLLYPPALQSYVVHRRKRGPEEAGSRSACIQCASSVLFKIDRRVDDARALKPLPCTSLSCSLSIFYFATPFALYLLLCVYCTSRSHLILIALLVPLTFFFTAPDRRVGLFLITLTLSYVIGKKIQ